MSDSVHVSQKFIDRLTDENDDLREQNERLKEVVKLAYRKHVRGDDDIGWAELGQKLLDGLCNAMGDEEFCKWNESAQLNAEGEGS